MSLRSILAPVDFSEDSLRGARLARDIAVRHEARLTLLHVDGLPVYDQHVAKAATAEGWSEYLEQRNKALEQQLGVLAAELDSDGEIEIAVARGDATKAIVERTAQKGYDLVVISPRGSGYGHHFLLGSVSADVAAQAVCPVLVARVRSGAPAKGGEFANPLIAVSNLALAERALELTMELAEQGTRLDLLHVLEGTEIRVGPPVPGAFHEAVRHRREELREQMAQVAKAAEQEGFATSVRVETGDPTYCALSRLECERSGLVVVSRKVRADGRGVLAPPAYRLLKHSPVPVLVVPGQARAG